eukprot:1243111-Rhodomonas_salina.7
MKRAVMKLRNRELTVTVQAMELLAAMAGTRPPMPYALLSYAFPTQSPVLNSCVWYHDRYRPRVYGTTNVLRDGQY